MKKTIYYLPGHSGRLTTGLGEALTARRFDVAGRETVGDFQKLPFSEQVSIIVNDLRTHYWQRDSLVIANSFGAYLFLHAQSSLPSYPGRVLILSPIVGKFASESTGTFFSPPYPKKLYGLAKAGSFPSPRDAHIHVGSEDWQSVPENVMQFGVLTGIPVTVVEKAGHMLPKDYVSRILDDWLIPST
jgi:hypothetical protein